MRVLRYVCIRLAALAILLAPFCASACDQIPAGESIWIRLTAPVSTYDAKVGDLVQGVVTQDVICGNETLIAVGSPILGTVQSVRKVGWGIRHETAALKIVFKQVAATPDTYLAISASIAEVDNARETVSNGVVLGIRSTSTLQGTITNRLRYLPALNPYPDLGLLVFKATFPIFPEPEIHFPAGTDMHLRLQAAVINPPSSAAVEESAQLDALNPSELRALAAALPERSTTTDSATADVVNLALLGSREQVAAAFGHAGWQSADPINRHSIFMNAYAFLKNGSYAHAPMRPFLLDGHVPDMNEQKSLNTYAQRDHMRIWEWAGTESTGPVFVGTATHDRSAGFSFKRHQFVHHIDPNIDDERSKIIRDLRAAGCVKAVYLVPRDGLSVVKVNATGDTLKTDGSIAVAQLQDCHAVVPELEAASAPAPYKPGNAVFRYLRRDILTVRSDIWRANIIYATYDLMRMGFQAWKHHSAVVMANTAPSKATPAVALAMDDQSLGIP